MRILAISLLLLFAAAPIAADDHVVLFDEDVNFSTFKTFMIHSGKVTSERPQLKYPAVMKALAETIRGALTNRGLKEADLADIEVEFSIDAVDFGIGPFGRANQIRPPAPGRRGNPAALQVDFTEATLVIDMKQAATRELVWRGVYRDSEDDAATLAGNLPKDAAQLLSQYPPRRKE